MLAKSLLTQVNAPGLSTYSWIIQLRGTVTPNTNTTAIPRPKAVFTFFEIARNEHMPKK